MTGKQKRLLIRIAVSGIVFLNAVLLPFSDKIKVILLLLSYLTVGYSVIIKAGKNIISGQIFDENFLMTIATVGAVAIGEYPEAVFVMLFYQIGELFEGIAVGKSRKSIAALSDMRPERVSLEREGGIVSVSPEEAICGEIMLIRPGERIPLDGTVVQGATSIDTSSLTGEPLPRDASEGDKVISGCINISGVIRARIDKPFSESTVTKIIELAESSALKKSKAESFISRFAAYYTPIVVIFAVLVAVIPSIFTGEWQIWVYRALSFLVISCPCALVISVPLAFFAGMGGASKQGLLFKGSSYIEQLSKCGIAVFDKTGTLTEGRFHVSEIICSEGEKAYILELAALAEGYSDHPIALSLKNAYRKELDMSRVSSVTEHFGKGISAMVDGIGVYAGNRRFMAELGILCGESEDIGTAVHIACSENGEKIEYKGCILISDGIKEGSKEAIGSLKRQGVGKTVMLTGDSRLFAEKVASELGIDEVKSELLPENKVEEVEKLLVSKRKGSTLVYVGDGINDAAALARADVGVSMGGLGRDAAIEASDIVIMDDDPRRLTSALVLSRRIMLTVKVNVVFSLIVKLAVLALSAFGICGMWEAVFADVGVMVIAVLNSIRLLQR